MTKTLLLTISLLLAAFNAKAQCTFTVQSTQNYTVVVTLNPTTVTATTPCNYGYIYNVYLNYTVSITGAGKPQNLYTLQGNLGCGTTQNFFNLPKTDGVGTTITANGWSTKTDCATATPQSLTCNTIALIIQGPGIPYQTLTCGFNNSTGVSSGNQGGLESDDCLAQAIAQRNYKRMKTPSVNADGKRVSYDNPKELTQFAESKGGLQTRGDKELESFVPQNPFDQSSTAYLSTPSDLIGITNAQKVLSVDYFDNNSLKRMAAVLSTQTKNGVYNHTKVVCDRLIGSELLSAENVEMGGKTFILSTLQRENGIIEYYINFSVNKETASSVSVTSLWSPEEYAAKDYWNFQVWADSPMNAKKLTSEILNKFKEQFSNVNSTILPTVPKVFVKKGSYDNGVLTLKIKNPINATQITLLGNYTSSETQKRVNLFKNIALSGAAEETVEVFVGNIYDAGFNLKNNKSLESDALYFADGAWGLDYDKNKSKVDYYDVNASISNGNSDIFTVERNPILRGVTKDYVSLFRSLRAGSVELDMKQYNTVAFSASGSTAVTVSLIKKSITEWSKQYRTEIQLTKENQNFELSMSDFQNGTSEPFTADDLVDIVFTVSADGKTEKAFDLSIENLIFDKKIVTKIPVAENTMKAFPNPASEVTELIFDLPNASTAQISLMNLTGKQISVANKDLIKGRNRVSVSLNELPSGIYLATITTANGQMSTKVIVP